MVKLANNIIDPNKKVRFKSMINRDNRKDACTLKDPRLGLTLLQIAIIADNIPAVEELIALGADVAVTVGQQHLEKGLLPDLGPDFWELKRQNLLTVHKAYEAVYNSLYGLIHLAVMGGSISAVRFLVNKGYADVNAPAANSGLTPLMCAALCRSSISRRTGELEDMRGMVDLLLELGGDLSRVNVVGNDIMAIAASARDRGLWKDIIADPALLSQCTARHAGRVALQLFASWNITKDEAIKLAEGQIAQSWCAEMTTMVHAWCDTASMAEACEARKRLVAELSEPVTQRVLWPGEGSKNIRAKPICEIFWPAQAQATTNGMAVPPDPIRVSSSEVHAMLKLLFELGVQPEALLLPRRPDQGKCKMLQPISLEALAASLVERCNGDLSQHKEECSQNDRETSREPAPGIHPKASRKRPNRIAMPEEVQTFEWKLDLHTPATGGDGVRTRRDAYETINAPQGWFIREKSLRVEYRKVERRAGQGRDGEFDFTASIDAIHKT
ncbi:g10089 [Coccomyxa viridis]|uniref:G10089 protein n=1 Tax=Coccomyxa viridis TaxID=1274662 RepID=A0ABP1G774_9CHLO